MPRDSVEPNPAAETRRLLDANRERPVADGVV
jgi:hypothetical protein